MCKPNVRQGTPFGTGKGFIEKVMETEIDNGSGYLT
jgi:hypothetical protein